VNVVLTYNAHFAEANDVVARVKAQGNGCAPQAAAAACHQGDFCAIVHVSPLLSLLKT
jgi:hypothetical protein